MFQWTRQRNSLKTFSVSVQFNTSFQSDISVWVTRVKSTANRFQKCYLYTERATTTTTRSKSSTFCPPFLSTTSRKTSLKRHEKTSQRINQRYKKSVRLGSPLVCKYTQKSYVDALIYARDGRTKQQDQP